MTEKQKLSIPAQYHQLDEQLARASYCFKLYQNIELDTSPIPDAELAAFKKKFYELAQAEKVILSQTLLIQIHKFFDKHHKAIHLIDLVNSCEANPEYNGIEQLYRNLLTEHNDTINKLRNKVYAHTDAYQYPEEHFENIKLTYTDLKEIIETMELLMSKIAQSLKLSRIPNIKAEKVQNQHREMILKVAEG